MPFYHTADTSTPLLSVGRVRPASAGACQPSKLAPLSDSERVTLISAMRHVQGLLERKPVAPTSHKIRALQVGDIGWIIHRQGLLYAQEYGWDISYEAVVAEILAGL